MKHHPLKTILRFGLLSVGVGIIGASALFLMVIIDLPDPTRISERPIPESTKIFDRTGTVILYEIHGEEKRTLIPFTEIPDFVKFATIAGEDSNFYTHKGIDIRGIFRALYIDIKTRNFSQGGSTITQQLVKNTLVGKEQTLLRKVREALLAILLETRSSKNEILNLYLNQIPYGSNAYGIEAAAKTFFGKQAKSLTLAQSALIASLPKAPSFYSPYGTQKKELFERKDALLLRMKNLGFISEKDVEQAQKEILVFSNPTKNILAPHFVMYVREYISDLYDESTIENGGLQIVTTLDWDLQQKAEQIIKDAAPNNEKNLGAKNAALTAIDPKTGQILAMVGSRDYWETKNDGNVNVTTRLRQPGSAFKPIAYVTAFQKGYTPETILFDVPTEFNPLCTPDFAPSSPRVSQKDCYHPKNYDNAFRGPVTLRQSLQQSLNIPSVQVLYLAGIEDTIQTAERLGITSLKDRSRFGLSLVLGAGEVKLLELVSAYGAFATDGILNPKTPILKITDSQGFSINEFKPNPLTVLNEEAVRTLNSVLTDNEARVPVFVRENSLYFSDRIVAAKTGTTQNNWDAWTIGYTPSLVAGVWVGNNDNSEMKKNTAGALVAAPLWKKFMQYKLAEKTPELFTPPTPAKIEKPILKGLWQGSEIIKIDKISRKLATEFTPKEYILEVASGQPHSILYSINKNDPLGPAPSNPENDSQFNNWEIAIQKWFQTSGRFVPQPLIIPGVDDVHTEKNLPQISILKTDFSLTEKFISVSILSPFPIQTITAEFNSESARVLKTNATQFILYFPSDVAVGINTLSISAIDTYGNRQTIEKEISIREQ
ncbi:MAG: transglycosylase domain-containing protein [Patescibacteria group bacterium]